VTVVVILVGSLEVKVPVAGRTLVRSAQGASNLTGRSKSEPGSPEMSALREADCRIVGRAEPLITWRRPMSEPYVWKLTGCDLPGVVEDGMSRRKDSESVEPLGGRLGAMCTAKASRISR
jgi:hypothetical protein